MKTLLLTASSSNEKSLNNFLVVLKENFKDKQISVIKIGRCLDHKKVVTVLKSPHVNKTAQEQFEKRKKIIQIFLISKNVNKILIFIKSILNTIFRDIKFTLRYLTNNHSNKNNALGVFKNTNFQIYCSSKIGTNKPLANKKPGENLDVKIFKTYLNILSHYGNIMVNKQ